MKALFYNFPEKRFFLKTKPRPETRTGEVLIKVKISALCGTDLHIIDGPLSQKAYDKKEIILGHSFSGVVEKIGGQVKDIRVGDRVFASDFVWCGKCPKCRAGKENLCDSRFVFGMESPGSNAEYLVVPERATFYLPEEVSFEEGSLICDLLALVCHAVKKALPEAKQKIMIFGAGPVGLALGAVLKERGMKQVFLSDPVDYRLKLAKKLGLKTVSKKELLKKENQFDIVFDSSGSEEALQLGYELLNRGGKMVMIGVQSKNFSLNSIKWISRELTLFGVFDFDGEDIKESLRLVKERIIDLNKLITHRFSLAEGVEAYKLLANKKSGKIIIVL